MGEVLFGTTLLASFLAGFVALLAPCCVSVMLPAYFATGFRSPGRVVGATLVFAAGIAAIIVPIGLGAAAVSAALSDHHTLLFGIGGAVMLVAGVLVLAGVKLSMPMPGGSAPMGRGIGSTFALGAFSGIASACCAPVLAGVAMLSGAATSWLAALGVSLTYVAGMVAPLMLLALLWDRHTARVEGFLRGRSVRLRLGRYEHVLSVGAAATGVLLVAMGVITLVSAVKGPGVPNDGWQVRVSAWLQHVAAQVTDALSWLPGVAFALVLLAAAIFVVRRALRPRTSSVAAPTGHPTDQPTESGPTAAATGPEMPGSCCGDGSAEAPAAPTATERSAPDER
ncbi:cytochrome c biogenesis protein CcdA [Nocardiopsis gilva YIM 90087]|uniref:Cytochrome c biogenesis protein CcdA n=1 Tax=Nocardiopsis gilva YIM 90087 TaxID=1235441 RepID=A0A223S1C2_9ACTN|nr:cytochrome c biogenesis CcdA family protein [Nocardiopsis gilva]ASU81829.1 cytochrome c biogenesis protein CcdA [Nocardiopsis gilva YIM 90087]